VTNWSSANKSVPAIAKHGSKCQREVFVKASSKLPLRHKSLPFFRSLQEKRKLPLSPLPAVSHTLPSLPSPSPSLVAVAIAVVVGRTEGGEGDQRRPFHLKTEEEATPAAMLCRNFRRRRRRRRRRRTRRAGNATCGRASGQPERVRHDAEPHSKLLYEISSNRRPIERTNIYAPSLSLSKD